MPPKDGPENSPAPKALDAHAQQNSGVDSIVKNAKMGAYDEAFKEINILGNNPKGMEILKSEASKGEFAKILPNLQLYYADHNLAQLDPNGDGLSFSEVERANRNRAIDKLFLGDLTQGDKFVDVARQDGNGITISPADYKASVMATDRLKQAIGTDLTANDADRFRELTGAGPGDLTGHYITMEALSKKFHILNDKITAGDEVEDSTEYQMQVKHMTEYFKSIASDPEKGISLEDIKTYGQSAFKKPEPLEYESTRPDNVSTSVDSRGDAIPF